MNLDESISVVITQRLDKRYILYWDFTGLIQEDAQEYGFKTADRAERYAQFMGWNVINPPSKKDFANQLNENALSPDSYTGVYAFNLHPPYPIYHFSDTLIYDEGATAEAGAVVMIDRNGDRVYFPWCDLNQAFYASSEGCNLWEAGFSTLEEALAFNDWFDNYGIFQNDLPEDCSDEEYERATYFCYNDYIKYSKNTKDENSINLVNPLPPIGSNINTDKYRNVTYIHMLDTLTREQKDRIFERLIVSASDILAEELGLPKKTFQELQELFDEREECDESLSELFPDQESES